MILGKDNLLSTIFKVLTPFIILFGIYLQVNGESSPGGGFQAGVIFACPFILHALLFNSKKTAKFLSPYLMRIISSFGIITYISVGLYSIFFSNKNFLNYYALAEDAITAQKLGIMMVELGIGMTIFSTIILIFYIFTLEE